MDRLSIKWVLAQVSGLVQIEGSILSVGGVIETNYEIQAADIPYAASLKPINPKHQISNIKQYPNSKIQ